MLARVGVCVATEIPSCVPSDEGVRAGMIAPGFWRQVVDLIGLAGCQQFFRKKN